MVIHGSMIIESKIELAKAQVDQFLWRLEKMSAFL